MEMQYNTILSASTIFPTFLYARVHTLLSFLCFPSRWKGTPYFIQN